MLETLAEIFATYGVIIIATMGVVVSIIPNLARRAERWVWVLAFIIVGAAVSTANYYELHSANVMQQQVWETTTGGKNFVYFTVFNESKNLVIVNPGRTPIYDVRVSMLEMEDKYSVRPFPPKLISFNFDTVTPGQRDLGQVVDGKVYFIDIKARNGDFFENMRLSSEKPRLQVSRIIRRKSSILSYAEPMEIP